MINILLVGLGGFIGSVLRYIISGLIKVWVEEPWIPLGTLAVNLLGCFLIGLLGGLSELRNVLPLELKVFLLVGVLGGFTTYSTFAYESMHLIKTSGLLQVFAYIGLHMMLGLAAAFAGFALVHMLGK